MMLGGHPPFIDAPPETPEPLGELPQGCPSYAALVARAIGAEAERLVANPPFAERVVYDASSPSPHAGATAGSLRFDSAFESANLRRAVQVGPFAYHLVLSSDINTRGHTQWFLFRVREAQPGVPYRLSIVNMMKPDSLFAHG